MCDCEIVFTGDYSAANRVEKHGMRDTGLWRRWEGMKKRCFYRSPVTEITYKNRGIGVYKKWSDSFAIFFRDMGHPPEDSYSLDRIDSDLHYCPHNVRWADKKMQARNRRLNFNGKYLPGVRYRKDTGKFFTALYINNKLTVMKGQYTNQEDAHSAYLKFKKEIHGVDYGR